jgi:hypothetical protein
MTFEEWWEQVEAYGLGLPEGYVLVPVEPTEKMEEAGYNAYVNSGWIRTYEIYEAMIQAAQEEE